MKRKITIKPRFWILIALLIAGGLTYFGFRFMDGRLSSFRCYTLESLRSHINTELTDAGQTLQLTNFTGGDVAYDATTYQAYSAQAAEWLLVAVTISEDGKQTLSVHFKKTAVADGDPTDEAAQFQILFQSVLLTIDKKADMTAFQSLQTANYNAEYGTSSFTYHNYDYFFVDTSDSTAVLITKNK